MVRNAAGANLNTGISSYDFELKPKFEIVVALFGAKELIVGNLLLKRSAYNRTVLNAEGFRGITFPAVEALTVKESDPLGG